MEFYERTLKSSKIFEGKILDLELHEIQLPDGRKSTREIVRHPGAVAIVALTDQDEVLLVRQYRKATEKTLLEIPAGKLEEREPKEECAQRELMEETGFFAEDLIYLSYIYTAPGFSDEVIHIFLAKNLKAGYRPLDEDEFIQVEKLRFDMAVKMALQGKIEDAKTIVGLILAKNYLEDER